MSRDEREEEGDRTKGEAYESAVLNFLEKEIAAPHGPVPQKETPADDVDRLVDSFLKEAIDVVEDRPTPPDRDAEDLDLLFSRIFSIPDEAPSASSQQAATDSLAPLPVETVPEAAGSAGVAPAETPAGRAAEQFNAPVMPILVQQVQPESVPVLQQANLPVPEPPIEAVEPAAPPERTLTFTFASGKQAAVNGRLLLVLGSAFACLLLGAGIVYFKRAGDTAPPAAAVSQAAQPASAGIDNAAVPAETPVQGGTAANLPARPARPVTQPTPAAASIAQTKSAAVAKRGAPPEAPKPAAPEPANAAPGAPNPAAAGVQAAQVAPPPATAVQPPAGAPGNPLLRAAEDPPTLAAVQTRPSAAGNLALTPRSSTSLEGLKPDYRPAPATPARSTITPVEVISRVMPVYPEIARRSRTAGTVVLEVQVDENGKPVKAIPESGPMILRTEAVNAVMQWKFKAATINGANVAGSIRVSLVFQGVV